MTAALDHLRAFSNTATGLINNTQADLVKNLKNLEPTIRALADVGPGLGFALAASTVFLFTQNFVDRAVRGDYFNLQFQFHEYSNSRTACCLGHTGGHWVIVGPAPVNRYYLNYTVLSIARRRRTGAWSRGTAATWPAATAGRSAGWSPSSAARTCSAESPIQRSATGTARATPRVWSLTGARGRATSPTDRRGRILVGRLDSHQQEGADMPTCFVRISVAIFVIVGISSALSGWFFYIQAADPAGYRRMTVTLELPATGGLYRFSNVDSYWWSASRQGDRGGAPRTVRESDVVARHFTQDPANLRADAPASRRSASIRGLAATNRRAPYLRDGRSSPCATPRFRRRSGLTARSGQRVGRQPRRTSSANCSTSRSRPLTVPATIWDRCPTRRRESLPTPTALSSAPAALTEDSGPLLDSHR